MAESKKESEERRGGDGDVRNSLIVNEQHTISYSLTLDIMSMTAWLVRNSNKPSEAMMTYLSNEESFHASTFNRREGEK